MSDQNWREWIVYDVGVLGGKPCIRGTRITVEFIGELLASGATQDDILKNYPHIPPEGVSAAADWLR